MALELRPSHDPDATWGFVGVVISTKDLSGSVFLWSRDASGKFTAQKVIEIPAEPCDPDLLPPLLKPSLAQPSPVIFALKQPQSHQQLSHLPTSSLLLTPRRKKERKKHDFLQRSLG